MSDDSFKAIIPYDTNSNLFTTSLIFEQNIDRIWLYLKDFNCFIKVIDFFENLKFIKGNNTWNEGNIFSFDWIGLTHLEIKCIYIKSTSNKKIIIWKAKGNIGINFYQTLCLYRITESNKALVKFIISRTEHQNELIDFSGSKNYYLNTVFYILENTSKFLNNIIKDTISYESCIINVNYFKVWEFIIDLKKLSEIVPTIGSKIEYSGEKLKVGSFLKFYNDTIDKIVFFKITKVEMPKKIKNWKYKLDSIGVNIKNLPIFIEIKVTIIDENKTQLSVLHKFSFDTDQKFIKFFSINKKEIMEKYVKYLENTNKKFKSNI
jgi:hypothetical protein